MKKPIAYRLTPIYAPEPGSIVTAALMTCAMSGRTLSGSGGGGVYIAPEIAEEIMAGGLRYASERRARHKKRGSTYDVLGLGEAQVSIGVDWPDPETGEVRKAIVLREGDKLTVYRGEDGRLHLRDPREFEDGRFEYL